jgi:hypothetical protein
MPPDFPDAKHQMFETSHINALLDGGYRLASTGWCGTKQPPYASTFMEQRTPVTRNATLWAGYGLILGVRGRRCQLRAVNDSVGLIVVEPCLTRFKARDHRMSAVMEVLGRVLAR